MKKRSGRHHERRVAAAIVALRKDNPKLSEAEARRFVEIVLDAALNSDTAVRRKPGAKITQAALKEVLHYDPATGDFSWITDVRRVPVGSKAGKTTYDGYRRICIDRRYYFAHHLAWLYVHGRWPGLRVIDHVNGVRSDNRIANLREATQSQNIHNAGRSRANKSGFKGVSRYGQRWVAFIKEHGRSKYLGSFPTPEEAHAAYAAAAQGIFKEFARTV